MALAHYNNGGQSPNPSPSYEEATKKPLGRLLATVCGYMVIALAVTMAVALGVATLFYYLWGSHSLEEIINGFSGSSELKPQIIAYLVVLGISFVALLIMSFVVVKATSSSKRSAWPAFIIYSVIMGILMSVFVLVVDLLTIAEALGISLAVFLVMFLIGRFSKVNLNPIGLVAIGLLFMMLLLGLFWGLFYWLNPTGFKVFDLVFSIVVCVLMMIITAVDSYNIKKILERGQASSNVLLFCAFVLYSDFITVLIRVLYILMRLKNNK